MDDSLSLLNAQASELLSKSHLINVWLSWYIYPLNKDIHQVHNKFFTDVGQWQEYVNSYAWLHLYFGAFETFGVIEHQLNQFWTQFRMLRLIKHCKSKRNQLPVKGGGLKSCCLPGTRYIDLLQIHTITMKTVLWYFR